MNEVKKTGGAANLAARGVKPVPALLFPAEKAILRGAAGLLDLPLSHYLRAAALVVQRHPELREEVLALAAGIKNQLVDK